MSDYRPSRYIMHSSFATVKCYPTMTASVTIPSTITTTGSDVVRTANITLPSTDGIGWRSIVTTTQSNYGVHTSNFLIPCKQTISGSTFDSFIYGEVIRSSSTTVQLRIVFTGVSGSTIQYSNVAQTFTLKLQPYISPFDE